MTMAFAGPASADPAFVTRSGGEIRFAALSGESNDVNISIVGGIIHISDSAGLTPGSGCTRVDPRHVTCGPASGVSRIAAGLGDQNDRFMNATSIPTDVTGGDGDDRIIGGNGPDRITDPDGWNAPPGNLPSIDGRGGNDTIISRNGGFDRVNCGAGPFDMLIADPATLDSVVPNTCESVQR